MSKDKDELVTTKSGKKIRKSTQVAAAEVYIKSCKKSSELVPPRVAALARKREEDTTELEAVLDGNKKLIMAAVNFLEDSSGTNVKNEFGVKVKVNRPFFMSCESKDGDVIVYASTWDDTAHDDVYFTVRCSIKEFNKKYYSKV